MTNQLKRSLAAILTVAMLLSVMIMTGVSVSAEGDGATDLGIDAAQAVAQEDAQDTALYATGDVNNDQDVNASDALMALQYSVSLLTLDRNQNRAADVNGDVLVDAADALIMLQKAVKLIDSFPVEDTTIGDADLTETVQKYTGTEYYLDGFETAKTLYVIGHKGSTLSIPERFCALGLQGLVARNGGQSQIAVVYDRGSYNTWLQELQSTYGIELVYVNDLWSLIDQFKSYIVDSHYVSYAFFDEAHPEASDTGELCSYANACTIAGQEGWLPIDSNLEAQVQELGLTAGTKMAYSIELDEDVSLGDATQFDEYDLIDHYGFGEGALNKDMFIMLGARDYNMRDVGIAKGCLFFTNNMERNLSPITKKLNPNAVLLGWVDSEGVREVLQVDNPLVADLTEAGVAIVPTDHANNISVYAGLEKANFKQIPAVPNAMTSTDKVHHVTLIMEGGTNYSHLECGFVDSEGHLPFSYWNNPARGTIPMGWTMTPAMTDLSPLILNYLYKTASVNDQFVAGLSGMGYNYSNLLGMGDPMTSAAVREEHYKRTAEYMAAANLEYLTVMESAPIDDEAQRAAQLAYYSKPSAIKGGFMYYLNGEGYVTSNEGAPGAVYWSNNKPFVNLRDALYYAVGNTLAAFRENGNKINIKSQADRNAMLQELAWTLNNRTKDAKVIDGYSAINVYQWAFSYDDCVTLSEMLDEDVVLVTPGEFLSLISKKVSKKNATVSADKVRGENDELPTLPSDLPEKEQAMALAASNISNFTFGINEGIQGWNLVAGDGAKDSAFLSESKGQNFLITLAGETVENAESGIPCGMIYNKIAVPSTATTLTVTTQTATSAYLRLLVVDSEGNEIIIPGKKGDQDVEWSIVASGKDRKTTWDISSIAGDTVAVYIQAKGNKCPIGAIDIE